MRALTLLLVLLAALAMPARAQDAPHHLVIHVDSPDRAVMTEALHNATNVIDNSACDASPRPRFPCSV